MVQIDTAVRSATVRLSVRGQLDLDSTPEFDRALREAARMADVVELDLGRVDFIDGSGLSSLIGAERTARRAQRRLTIVAASMCVRRLIDLTGTGERVSYLKPRPRRSDRDRARARAGANARPRARRGRS